jgi:hypothetical protein
MAKLLPGRHIVGRKGIVREAQAGERRAVELEKEGRGGAGGIWGIGGCVDWLTVCREGE